MKAPSIENFVNIANALNVSADELLVDVLNVGYKVKASKLSEIMDALSPEERQRIFTVVEAMVKS